MALEIADKLRQIREARGWSQEELARQLGVSFPTVNSWERGKTQPYPRHQHAIQSLHQQVMSEIDSHLVLIVEDDESARLILADYVALALPGYAVCVAVNGYDAILQIGLHKPAIVLLDIMMPDIDGLEVFARIRQMEELAAVRVLFVTAVTDEAVLERARAAKPFDLIHKPLDRRMLVAALKRAADLPEPA